MNREIKFRAWDKNENKMFVPSYFVSFRSEWFNIKANEKPSIEDGIIRAASLNASDKPYESDSYLDGGLYTSEDRFILMQFTGRLDKDGKQVYEGDIFRAEEETDGLDEIYYLVVVWIHEWSMFATLRTDEYHKYLKEGAEALDEPLFWTYTLEDVDHGRCFLCGNIYETPELLER